MEYLIQVEDITYSYRDDEESHLALDGLSFDLLNGEHLAVLGHNGSGKSTLAKMLNAILVPDQGRVLVKGMDTRDEDLTWDIRKTCSMVFQNPDNQIVATIVEEEIAFGPENLGVDPLEIRKRVEETLSFVSLEGFEQRNPSLLSGGQKQRIAIAGVLAMEPEIIVMDEPTAMLDPQGRKDIMDTIDMLNKEQGMTIVNITHHMEEAVRADRVLVMDKGKFVMGGTPREVFSQVEKIKSYGLDVPQVTELAFMLEKKGYDIDANILEVEELVDRL